MSSAISSSSEIKPFIIDLDQELLSDLQDRLAKTRMPAYPADGIWSAGTDPDYLEELLNFWQHSFGWRKQEAILNKFSHFKTEIAGIDIHYHSDGHCGGPRGQHMAAEHERRDVFGQRRKRVQLLHRSVLHGIEHGRNDLTARWLSLGRWHEQHHPAV
jgi:hypothetical protein